MSKIIQYQREGWKDEDRIPGRNVVSMATQGSTISPESDISLSCRVWRDEFFDASHPNINQNAPGYSLVRMPCKLPQKSHAVWRALLKWRHALQMSIGGYRSRENDSNINTRKYACVSNLGGVLNGANKGWKTSHKLGIGLFRNWPNEKSIRTFPPRLNEQQTG